MLIFFLLTSFMNVTNATEQTNLWTSQTQVLCPTNNLTPDTVIMIHGFAGSPFDFKPLAEKLFEKGYKIILPATPGQLKQTYSSKDVDYLPAYYVKWINNLVSNELDKAKGKVFLVGFSMGGTLSTIAAASNKIDKLVLLAPFYSLTTANTFVWKISRVFAFFIRGVPNLTLGAINDPKGNKEYKPGSKVLRLDGYDALEKLALIAADLIPQIKIPILILGSENDEVASFNKTKELFEEKENVKIIEYNKSNHVLLYDYDRDSVISNVIDFLSEN